MHSPEATIYCSNSLCQAPNPESHQFCDQCRTPLPKHYLWAIGKSVESIRPGELLAGRYWCKHPRVFVDTKPGFLPESLDELPEAVDPYLRLVPYWSHVPQIYALLSGSNSQMADIVLLDHAPLYSLTVGGQAGGLEGNLMPELESVWAKSPALRQLNWLWQIARLWEPLAKEGVASSLLNSAFLRVEGALLRLLELQSDSQYEPLFHTADENRSFGPSLVDVGKLWQRWQPLAQPEIGDFLAELCIYLIQGRIATADDLMRALDQGLAVCGRAQSRQLRIATLSDQGPSRQRNEDACYPASGKAIAPLSQPSQPPMVNSATDLPLVVVCDGIGGHEGGNIASNLAIATIQPALQALIQANSPHNPSHLTFGLEQATLAANTIIVQRNDQENRHERQRMGTTLVMALGYAHELYITHVGDSRAYRITRTGCHQITLDDDLAAREVRLGYALYRDALQQPGSGSLVQALGMNPSSMVRPTVQRFVLDEDCLFLLCSDGLSDNDRVDQYWQTIFLPVLEGTVDVAMASQQLVDLANQKNGHDNVTVGLVHCRVGPQSSQVDAVVPAALATPVQVPTPDPTLLVSAPEAGASNQNTQRVVSAPSQPHSSSLWLGLLMILGLAGVLAYVLLGSSPSQWFQTNTTAPSSPAPVPTPVLSPSIANSPSSPPTTPPLPALSIQSRVQVNRSTTDQIGAIPLSLLTQLPETGQPTKAPSPAHTIPVGSVLKVIGQQVLANQRWLQFKVCVLPEPSSSTVKEKGTLDGNPGLPMVQAGESGWVLEAAIAPLVTSNFSLTGPLPDKCDTERKGLD